MSNPLNLTISSSEYSRLEIRWHAERGVADLLLYAGSSSMSLIWQKRIEVNPAIQQAELAKMLKPLAELCHILYQSENGRAVIPELVEALFDLRGLLHNVED